MIRFCRRFFRRIAVDGDGKDKTEETANASNNRNCVSMKMTPTCTAQKYIIL